MENRHDTLKGQFQNLVGAVVSMVGISSLGVAVVIAYADWLQDLPSTLVVYGVIVLSAGTGLFCIVAGARLISDRKTKADRILLAPFAWRLVACIFFGFSLLLLFSGKRLFAVPAFVFAILCFMASHAIRWYRTS